MPVEQMSQMPDASDGLRYAYPLRAMRALGLRNFCVLLITQLLIPLATYGPLLLRSPHFSPDSYLNWYTLDWLTHLRGGRLVSWAITRLEILLGFNPVHHSVLSIAFFITVTALVGTALGSMVVVAARREHRLGFVVGTSLAVSVSFASIFLWEWYTFVECLPFYAAAICFAVGSVGPSLRRGWRSIVGAITLVALATMSYQVAMPMAGIWSVMVLLASDGFEVTKATVARGMRIVGCCVAGGVVGIAIPRLLSSLGLFEMTRGNPIGLDMLLENVRQLLTYQETLWVQGFDLLPSWSLVAVLAICVCAVLFGCWYLGRGFGPALSLLAPLFGCYVLSLALHLFVEHVSLIPRTLVPVSCFLSVLLMCTFGVCHDCGVAAVGRANRQPSWVPAAFAVVTCLSLLAMNVRACWGATRDHYLANDADAQWGATVASVIDRYEAETGNHIDTLWVANDTNPTYAVAPALEYASYGINMRAVPVGWATVYIVEYYGDRQFDTFGGIGDAVRDRVFGWDRDDDAFDESQVVFDGTTAYVLVY